jgi:hypothetical protein
MLVLKMDGREDSRASSHFTLTYEAYARFRLDLGRSAHSLAASAAGCEIPDSDLWDKQLESAVRYLMVQHLYAAMCLEAFIYDYAATNLGDTYVQKYLDKLDLVSKWVIIPRLVLGKEISRDGQAFEYLRLIKRERDKLVHSKSRAKLTEEKRQKELAEYKIELRRGYSGLDTDKDLNVFAQLVDILGALKKLEKECGRAQVWWEIVEVPD